ncbi:MAG: GldG family protein [Deltaproteobacteria bacterium]|uniref:GldG family protein n=1 Tax=Candidatus Zymogenus saltonus TaxID=2844893 RepID=A0A9D8KFB8_9DELT|nr:GldG family protein [Candidatus Zymogenus saltonus]
MKKTIQSIKGIISDLREKSSHGLTRSSKYGMSTAAAILLVIGIVVFIEVISYNNNKQFDLTKDKRFTLSPQTEKIMKSLEDNLEAVAFYSTDDPTRIEVEELLKLYKYASEGMFDYSFVDMDLKPAAALEYNIHENESVVFKYGDRHVSVRVTKDEIYDEGEKKLTNTILKAIYTKKKAIYFLTQHGERDIDGTESRDYKKIREVLENQNYSVNKLDLLTKAEVPEDASLLVIAGPKTNLFEEELKSINNYLEKGGSLLVTLDAEYYSPSLEKYLAGLGVKTEKDIIIDTESRVHGGDYTIPRVEIYLAHPITKDFDIPSFFFLARSIEIDKDAEKSSGWDFSYIAKTGKNSWGETNIGEINKGKASLDKDKDIVGPVPVVIAGAKEIENVDEEEEAKKEAKMVVFGDSDFVNNSFFINEGNMNLFVNSVNWLCDVEELISILPKDKKVDTLILAGKKDEVFLLLSSFLVPLLLIITGTAVIIFRRRKA